MRSAEEIAQAKRFLDYRAKHAVIPEAAIALDAMVIALEWVMGDAKHSDMFNIEAARRLYGKYIYPEWLEAKQ